MLQNKCTKMRAARAVCALFSSLNKSESHWLNEDRKSCSTRGTHFGKFLCCTLQKKERDMIAQLSILAVKGFSLYPHHTVHEQDEIIANVALYFAVASCWQINSKSRKFRTTGCEATQGRIIAQWTTQETNEKTETRLLQIQTNYIL